MSSSPGTESSEEWVLLVETPAPELFEKVTNLLERHDYEYRWERDNKPLWEPMPHSTLLIYVKERKADPIRKQLIAENLISE